MALASPTLLIIDDKLDEAQDYVELFQEIGGFRVVTAASVAEAERRVAAEPGLEAVSTDISLSSEGMDIDGAAFAQTLAARLPGIPIAGYSGFRSRSDLPREYQESFRHWIERGASVTALHDLVTALRTEAFEYRSARARRSLEFRTSHGLSSGLSDEVYEVVQDLCSTRHGAITLTDLEDALHHAGFLMKAVMPVFRSDSPFRARSPVVCWVRTTGEEWEGEVIGQPSLYAAGRSQEEVLSGLVELVDVFADQLGIATAAESRPPRSGPAASLTAYLDSVVELH